MFKLSSLSVKKRFSISESIEIIKQATGSELTINELIQEQDSFSIQFNIDLNTLSETEKDFIKTGYIKSFVTLLDNLNLEDANNIFIRDKYVYIWAKIKAIKGKELELKRPVYNGTFAIYNVPTYGTQEKIKYENGIFYFNSLISTYTPIEKGQVLQINRNEYDYSFIKGFIFRFDKCLVSEKHIFITDFNLERFINILLFPSTQKEIESYSEIQDELEQLKNENNVLKAQLEQIGTPLTFDGNIPPKTDQDKLAHFIELIIQKSEFMKDGKIPTYSELHTMLSHKYPHEAIPSKNTIKKYLGQH